MSMAFRHSRPDEQLVLPDHQVPDQPYGPQELRLILVKYQNHDNDTCISPKMIF